jgi:hypothetical protein
MHCLNHLSFCALQPADGQTRVWKCHFRRSRDFTENAISDDLETSMFQNFSARRQPCWPQNISKSSPQKKHNLLLKNGSRLKCLKISLVNIKNLLASHERVSERVSVDGVRKRCQMFPLQGQQFNSLNSIYLPPGTYSFIKWKECELY